MLLARVRILAIHGDSCLNITDRSYKVAFLFVGFSAVCVLTWGLVMHYLVDGNLPDNSMAEDKCWKGYSNYPYIWILAGPMTAALFVS